MSIHRRKSYRQKIIGGFFAMALLVGASDPLMVAYADAPCAQLNDDLIALYNKFAQICGCPADNHVVLHNIISPSSTSPSHHGSTLDTTCITAKSAACKAWMPGNIPLINALEDEKPACIAAACPPIPATLPAHCGCRPTTLGGKLDCSCIEDADGDGIPDSVEKTLIARFSPFLRFSTYLGNADENRPIDPIDFIKLSSLVAYDSGNELVSNTQLAADPSNVITYQALPPSAPTNLLNGFSPSADYSSCPNAHPRANVAIKPSVGNWASGADWASITTNGNVGMFAHISPFTPDSAADLPGVHPPNVANCFRTHTCYEGLGNRSICPVIPTSVYESTCKHCYKIEYYQFFGLNNDHVAGNPYVNGLANHEGDLSILTVIYDADPAKDQLVAVSHWIHGMEVRFDLQSPQSVCALAKGELFGGDQMTCTGENRQYDSPQLEVLKLVGWFDLKFVIQDLWQAQNNEVSFAPGPSIPPGSPPTVFEHPIVFVEYGSHEFWPTTRWSVTGAPAHPGDDNAHSYLTHDIDNLGEIEHPLSDKARIIVEYSGIWGDTDSSSQNPSSPGMSLHTTWNWWLTQRPPIECSEAEN